MKTPRTENTVVPPLPQACQPLFWDCSIDLADWQTHRSFVVQRILTEGRWEHISWLRRAVGDEALRAWLLDHQGSSLSPQQLRFWELILGLPTDIVNTWIADPIRQLWYRRTS
jgi:hypothetical protein